ncbi:Chromosome partition protein Smc [Pandoraea bronchicola]|uniref:Chromosome partition protein Smc n=2 Tax=Pandoraea bronchicola TaxID=2508287 RepID=A0A5E5BRU7_9BURK|nr:Chromosome partition protein Smc [Pandoraea bronchicola]
MYGYVYAPAASWPQRKCELKQKAAANGKSIADKHAEIVRQFQQIANTKAQLGLSSESIAKLESAFFSTYKKATSGYWGGGLWDGFYRYASNPSRQGLYFLVGEQLRDRDIESLTPSARRFSMILGHLADALRKEDEIMRKCGEMIARSTSLRNATFEDIDAERAEYAQIGAACMDVLAEIEQCLDAARETTRRGAKEVWPEKKHFGKRFAISAALYCMAGGIAIAGLIASSGTLAVVGVVLTMVIRVVSLGSIRGFDRERGWKSIESLLASTKQLIETEGATMKTYLDISDRRAALAREDRVWDLLTDLRTQTRGLNGRVSAMAEQVSSVVSGMDSLRDNVGQRFDAMEQRFGAVEQRFGAVEQQFGAVEQRFGAVEQRFGAVEQRFGAVEQRVGAVEQRFGAVEQRLGAVEERFGAVEERFGAVEERLGAVEERFGAVEERFGTVGERFGAMEQRFETMEVGMETALTTGFSGVESKLDDFRSDLQRLSRVQEAMSARLAMAMPATYPAQAARSNRPMPERANSWSPYTHSSARRV